jgi:hypothetical protein
MNCASKIGWDRDFVSDAEAERRWQRGRYLNLGINTDYLLLEEKRTTATTELSKSAKSMPDPSRLAALARGARGPLVLTLSPERRGNAR